MYLQPNMAFWRRIGTWLALLALTLQLVVGAAHHHAGVDVHDASLTGITDTGTPAAPSVPDSDNDCQVCLGLSFAAMAILPIAIIVAIAVAIGNKPHLRLITIARSRLGAFRSRAPPLPNCA
jgi:hypothetical protein